MSELRSLRVDRNLLARAAYSLVFHNAVDFSKQSKVPTQANVQAGFYRGAQLTHQNGAGGNCLAAVNLGSPPLTL